MSQQILFKNFATARTRVWRAPRRLRGAGRGRHDQGGVATSRSRRPRPTVIDCGRRTLMPGLIDCHVHAHPQRGQHPLHGGDAADADDRARGDAIARHARPRLHHRARHRRRRLGHQDRRRNRAYRRPAAVHRRPVDRPDRRPYRLRAGAPTLGSAAASAATACSSSPRSPTASTRCARPRASRCARAPTR